MFSLNLSFAPIPKAFGFEATRFPTILLGGSPIPIDVIGMGMALLWLNTYFLMKLIILLLSCKYAISANLLISDVDSYYGLKKDRHISNTRGQLDVGF